MKEGGGLVGGTCEHCEDRAPSGPRQDSVRTLSGLCQDSVRTLSGLCQDCQDRCRRSTNQVEVRGELLFAGFRVAKEGADGLEAVHSPRGFVCLSPWLGGRLQHRKREGAGQLGTSEPLSCEERGGFCAVRTLSERCQNTVRTLSERCQNGQVSVRTGVGAPQTRLDALFISKIPCVSGTQGILGCDGCTGDSRAVSFVTRSILDATSIYRCTAVLRWHLHTRSHFTILGQGSVSGDTVCRVHRAPRGEQGAREHEKAV